MLREITEKEFYKFVGQEKAIVEFYSPICSPCKKIEPILFQNSLKTGIPVAKINALEAPQLCQEYCITGVPTLFFFKYGKLVKELRGAVSGEKINGFFYY
jgi:thioredoxin-like negative regulator of GroEL